MSEKEKQQKNGLEEKIRELEQLRDKAQDKKTKEFYEYALKRYKELNINY